MIPLLLALKLFASAQSAAASSPESSEEALIASALDGHPDVTSINAKIDALGHSVAQAWVWPDPVAAVEYSNMPVLAPWPGNHPMSGIQFKLTQQIPFPTKFFARADAAHAARDAAVPMREEAENQLASRVRLLVVQWRLAAALERVTEQHVAAVGRLLDAVRVKYELGRVEQHDLIRLEVLQEKLSDDVAELARRRDGIGASINAAAQRAPGAPLALGDMLLVPTQAVVDVGALLDEAKAKRPLLASISLAADAERANASAVRSEKWPDVTAWAGYRVRLASGQDPGNNFVTAGIAVPIPWASVFWKWEEKALAFEARARSEEARRVSVELSLQGEIEAALVRFARAAQRADVYEAKLIPGAQKTLDATFASYQVDRASFVDLFSAELAAIDFERVALNARAEAATASVTLDTLIGRYADSRLKKDSSP